MGQHLQTLARRWRAVLAAAREWEPPAVPTLVVAPHPDDEVLSSGGLIARQRGRGLEVRVLAVTDGEAAYRGWDGLGARRRAEQLAGLAELGVPDGAVTRLGLPDGRVGAHERQLAALIARAAAGCGLVVAPWTGDHHTDHEACGRAAAAAVGAGPAELVHGLFWAWHHRRPERLPTAVLVRLTLTEQHQRQRGLALQQHRSQLCADFGPPPVLGPAQLQPVGWAAEYYIRIRR